MRLESRFGWACMDDSLWTFAHYGETVQVPRQWFAAVFTSSVLYVLLAVAVLTIGTATKQLVTEKSVDVTFVEKIAKPEPSPPPPPVVEAKPQPPPAAAPAVPKNMTV